MKLAKAIFPVAGLGTRFLPATKAQPKEMLTVVDKPLIQYAVEEAYQSGIRQMIFITGRNKRAIEDHYDANPELERSLVENGKDELHAILKDVVPEDLECVFIRQAQPLGLGNAVLQAKSIVGDEDFAVILADDLIHSQTPVLGEMLKIYNATKTTVIAVNEVPEEEVHKYGVIKPSAYKNKVLDVVGIESMVEKPKENAPSNLAIVGRYVLSNQVMIELDKLEAGVGGEVQLTDAINNSLPVKTGFAFQFEGTRYDCGSKLGFLKAQVAIALEHPELKGEFSTFLDSL